MLRYLVYAWFTDIGTSVLPSTQPPQTTITFLLSGCKRISYFNESLWVQLPFILIVGGKQFLIHPFYPDIVKWI